MITRDVEPAQLADLLRNPPRAALAAVVDGRVELYPVGVVADDPGNPRSLTVTMPPSSPDLAKHDVVVVIDDGAAWFELRSLTFRGSAVSVGAQTYSIVPTRVVAWDYGALRQASDSSVVRRRPLVLAAATDADREPPFSSAGLDAELATSRVMIVASRSPSGRPFAVPLWFTTCGGRLLATTSASSWTVRNVAACPHVVILFGGGRQGDATRLIVPSRASAVTGAPPPTALARIAWRYYLSPRFAATELAHARLWTRRIRYYTQSRPAYLVITPQSAVPVEAPLPPR